MQESRRRQRRPYGCGSLARETPLGAPAVPASSLCGGSGTFTLFGMHVGRINVTRRQLKLEDKRTAQELSSGDATRFGAAIETLIERGVIRRGGITEAVEAILANRNWKKPVETIVLSSTHRVAEKVSKKLHESYKAAKPEVKMAQIAAFKVKALQPAELLSTASYHPGEIIEFQPDKRKPSRLAEVLDVVAEEVQVKGQLKGATELIRFERVQAVYGKTILERGAGEVLLLTQKIKVDGKVYENGSRQTIATIDGDKMRFASGLELRLGDGRVRQGDALTTYKAQGASKTEMIRVEDNRSLLAMANREDLHVAFTRHRASARMFVQDINVLRRVANRSLIKNLTARDLESRKIASGIERIEEALTRAARENAISLARADSRRRHGGLADSPSFLEAEISLPAVHRLTDDDVIEHLDLKNPGSFAEPAGEAKIGFAWTRVTGRMIMHQDESVC
jgi:hypothetical protein